MSKGEKEKENRRRSSFLLHFSLCSHLRRHDRLDRGQDPVPGHEADRISQARVRRRRPVRPPHPAAGDDVGAQHLARAVGVHDDDDAEVVGEQVDRVVARHRHRDLELAREELRAVDGLRGAGEVGAVRVVVAGCRDLWPLEDGARELLAVEPDVVVGPGLRREQVRDVLGEARARGVVRPRRLGEGRGGRADVPVDVAAGAERRAHRLDDGGEGRLEVALEHACFMFIYLFILCERSRGREGGRKRERARKNESGLGACCFLFLFSSPPQRRCRNKKKDPRVPWSKTKKNDAVPCSW